MSDVVLGVLLSLFAGVVNGSFATPSKYAAKWKWENLWAVYGVVGMFIVPWLLGFATIPDLLGFYRTSDLGLVLLILAFGVGNGLAQIFFGLGVTTVGLALGFAIAIGISTALGTFVPLVVLQSDAVYSAKGVTILIGVASILIGIVFCAVSGRKKELRALATTGDAGPQSASKSQFMRGLVLCILAGVLSPVTNFALAFGAPLLAKAADQGVGVSTRTNVIWPLLLTASFVPYLIYCIYLWRKNTSFGLYRLPGTGKYWLFGLTMGVLWMGSSAIYGAATGRMASWGPILGWPLFMSVVIITADVWGFATGEWRGAGRRLVATMLTGILFLVIGFIAVAYGSSLG